MQQLLSCGQFTCRINGSNELINCIPSYWKENWQEMQASSDTVAVYLEKAAAKCFKEFPDGWTFLDDGIAPQAVYVRNGEKIFSLQFKDKNEAIVRIGNCLGNTVRLGIHYGLMLALHQRCIGLHGVTLLCGNEFIILSAPSGTGKTTMAKLLEQHIDAIVLNGDFALLNPTENGVIFEPTPFCGTSGRALNHRVRINRVVFLSQAKSNEWQKLSARKAMMNFMDNSFVPAWDSSMQQAVQKNILHCISAVKVNAYAFAPTPDAANVFIRKIQEDSLVSLD